jgi:nucleotide-binding universal stress UspA family protein
MQAFQKILFPIDMSDSCTAAVPYVETMAKKFNAGVTLLHVLETPPAYATDWYGYMALTDTGSMREAREKELGKYLEGRFEGRDVQRVMLEGDPATEITKFAQEQETDLIMMPTHGYGVFRRLLLGSVTAKVLHDSTCPVWTGVHLNEPPARPPVLERIMCAVDLTKSSLVTLRFAAQLACNFNAKLWLVHGVPGPDAGPEKYFDSELQGYLEEEARKAIGEMQRTVGTGAQLCIASGEVPRIVEQAALHHSADLLVIGRGHATRMLGPLRTNVHSIIRRSPCPVISV